MLVLFFISLIIGSGLYFGGYLSGSPALYKKMLAARDEYEEDPRPWVKLVCTHYKDIIEILDDWKDSFEGKITQEVQGDIKEITQHLSEMPFPIPPPTCTLWLEKSKEELKDILDQL